MAYDDHLAERVRDLLSYRGDVEERKMFGGLAFMVGGNMCCGVLNDELMLRVGPEQGPAALQRPHTREMDFTGRPMNGMLFVQAEGHATDEALAEWVAMATSFVSSLPPKTAKAPRKRAK
jgi:TfoX/Sxy family transcriptional regulator of competence genes